MYHRPVNGDPCFILLILLAFAASHSIGLSSSPSPPSCFNRVQHGANPGHPQFPVLPDHNSAASVGRLVQSLLLHRLLREKAPSSQPPRKVFRDQEPPVVLGSAEEQIESGWSRQTGSRQKKG